jgi:hypothetical protein
MKTFLEMNREIEHANDTANHREFKATGEMAVAVLMQQYRKESCPLPGG